MYLAQTDTTAGLLSKNPFKLNQIKGRNSYKPVLREVDSLKTLKGIVRVPKHFKNQVRRLEKTTFIYHNSQAIRVVRERQHLGFLQHFGSLYSSSANKTGDSFDYEQAFEMCDVLVIDSRGIFSSLPSKIFQINQSKIKKIR
ncbi:hypothetical protein BKH44_03290 [Helicobacter sp. 13S00477-4]|nr:hypothetical protein BKH44_03290 [Helicobacter sp. 13S00477-4]